MLVIIILFSVSIRSWGITTRGVFDYDEGWYLLEAKSLVDTVDYVIKRSSDSDDIAGKSLKAYLRDRGTVPITSLKPAHNLLTFAAFSLLGVSDTSALLMSVLLGVLTLMVVFRIAQHLFDARTALLSTAVLAASGFHIYYSRSAMAQADSTFFAALGILLWVAPDPSHRARSLWLAGVSLGLSVTCHYNAIILPATILGFEIIRSFRHQTVTRGTQYVLALLLGSITPVCTFEIVSLVCKLAAGSPEGLHTYFEQFSVRDTGRMASDIAFYPLASIFVARKFLFTEGIVVLLATGVGIVHLMTTRFRRIEIWMLLAVAIGPIAVWSLFAVGKMVMFRVMPIAFPALAIVAGYAISQAIAFASRNTHQRASVALAVTIGFLLLTGGWRSAPLVQASSGYREATSQLLDWVERHGGTIGFRPGSVWPVWNFYLSQQYDHSSDRMRQHIRPYLQQDEYELKGDFDPLDFRRYYRAVHLDDIELSRALVGRARSSDPIVVVDNTFTRLDPRYFGAMGYRVARNLEHIRRDYPTAYDIRIHDVRRESPAIAEAVR